MLFLSLLFIIFLYSPETPPSTQMKHTRHTHLKINVAPNTSVSLIDFSVCVCETVYVRVADRVTVGWRGGEGEWGAEINHLTSGRRVHLRLWDRMRRSGGLMRTDTRGASCSHDNVCESDEGNPFPLLDMRSRQVQTGPSCIQVTDAKKTLPPVQPAHLWETVS